MMLADQTALVTGGGSGIGEGIAMRLAQAGAAVGVIDIDPASAARVAEAIRSKAGKALALPADVADRGQVRAAVVSVLREWDRIDILVNNAGIAMMRNGLKVPFVEMADEEWDRVIDVNLTGMYNCCKACVPPMISRHYGRVVNIASTAGKTGGFAAPIHYVASKAAVIGFTKALAMETAAYGINANVVMPSRIETNLGMSAPPEVLAKRLSQIPLGRFGTPRDVAEAVLFLVNPEASSWITGATLNLSGGALMD